MRLPAPRSEDFLRLLAIVAALSSCAPDSVVPGSAAYVDHIFASTAPDSLEAFADVASKVIELPDDAASAYLYASLAEVKPRLVFLSPLLASEIDEIADAYDGAFVISFGWSVPSESLGRAPSRTAFALFSRAAAASAAGAEAAKSSKPRRPVAAVFAGGDKAALDAAAEAFASAFRAGGGLSDPVIEICVEPFSTDAAARLSGLDAGFAYVSAPLDTYDRWARESFGPDCAVVAEYSLPPSESQARVEGFISWDLKATIERLWAMAERGQGGVIDGIWAISRRGKGFH